MQMRRSTNLLEQKGVFTNIIPFYSQTTDLIAKVFKRNPIFLKEIKLEGDLSTTDETTILIGAHSEKRYGKFIMYPDEECKELKITPAYQDNRTGLLILTYEGQPFKTTYVGTDADLIQLVARARSVLAGHGQTNVTTAGTRVQLTTTKTRIVEIRAKGTNTGIIYLGDITVTSSNGYILTKDDPPVQLPVDASGLYIDASVNGEGVSWIGWK